MSRLKRWLPGLQILSEYQAAWFPRDVMAGLVLATMLVPVGIAYALASGVPGIYGLYATIVPLLAYALFGPSRILVLGPDSSLAPVILAVVLPLSGGDDMRAVTLASRMAVVAGVVCELIGVSIDSAGPLRDLARITDRLVGGQVNWTSFAVGAGTLAAILLLKPYKRIPGLLLAVLAATVVVGILNLDATAGVKVLGPLPQGLPSLVLPMISFAYLGKVIIGGCAVAIVAFADTSVLSRTYAAKVRTPV